MTRSAGRAPWLVGIAAWIAAPLVVVTLLSIVAFNATPSGTQRPTWVPVRAAAGSSSEPVDLALMWTSPPSITAPAWSGLVQSVDIARGTPLVSGTRIVTIDGVPRIAGVTPGPFYRPISRGDEGTDVAWLNGLLAELGYEHGDAATATGYTREGILALGESLGITDATTFDPSWIVFVPSASYVVDSVGLTVATGAPSLGTAILTGRSTLNQVGIVPKGALDAFTQAPTKDGKPFVVTPELMSAYEQAVPNDSTVVLGTSELALNDARTAINPSSFEAVVASVMQDQSVVQANIDRVASAGDILLPAAAVFGSSDDKLCVRARNAVGRISNFEVALVAQVGEQVVVRSSRLSDSDFVQVGLPSEFRKCT